MVIHCSPISFVDFFHVFTCATWEIASTHNFHPQASPGLKRENHSKVCVLPWHCHQKLLWAFHAFPKQFFLSMKINLMQRCCSFLNQPLESCGSHFIYVTIKQACRRVTAKLTWLTPKVVITLGCLMATSCIPCHSLAASPTGSPYTGLQAYHVPCLCYKPP